MKAPLHVSLFLEVPITYRKQKNYDQATKKKANPKPDPYHYDHRERCDRAVCVRLCYRAKDAQGCGQAAGGAC